MHRAVLMLAAITGCVDADSRLTQEIGQRDIHVDPEHGNDSSDGSSPFPADPPSTAGPLRSLARAQTMVGPGSTVHLRGGRYGRFTFGRAWSGTAAAGVTVQSWAGDATHPAETAIFDPGDECFLVPQGSGCELAAWRPCSADERCTETDCCSNVVTVSDGAAMEPHPDEYMSSSTFDVVTHAGTMLDSRTRLLSYSRIEDLRATNESDIIMSASDLSRPAGGRLALDPLHKRPWTYRGPGMWWNPATGRIHVRLSHTHLGIPGVADYTGPTDPNQVSMSIASFHQQAANSTASFITFRRIVFQNGGDVAMSSGQAGNGSVPTDVTFDHCTFQGGRHVFALGEGIRHTFDHCSFSALLGGWVARQDVKEEYDFMPPGSGAVQKNHTCNTTSDILLKTSFQNEYLVVANSEFRDSHDAMQVWGKFARIHHNLIENINDEAFLVDGHPGPPVGVPGGAVEDLRIYKNVIRKTLDVFSHAGAQAQATDGARYYYRNIIDNRIPVLVKHRQPADGQAIWRVGADFKLNNSVGEFYAYHNTVVQAFPDLGVLTQAMEVGTPAELRPRQFVNNIHVTYDGNEPLYTMPPGPSAFADGNVWSQRTTVITAPRYTGNADPRGGNDANSRFGHPLLANVPDYGLPHAVSFENADYRLQNSVANIAIRGGIDLRARGWPDEHAVVDHPDVGALPLGSVPLKVGIDGGHVFPVAGSPIAVAGDYATIPDLDGDGFQTVSFSASNSTGDPTSFTWRHGFGGPVFGIVANATRALPVGTHKAFLAIANASGQVATDMREVTIVDPDHISNLVVNPGWDSGTAGWTFGAGGAVASTFTHFGAGALRFTGAAAMQHVDQIVPITPDTRLTVSGWIKGTFASTRKARIVVEWLSANGTVVATSPAAVADASAAYRYHASPPLVAPASAVAARIQVSLDAGTTGAEAYFDDVRARNTGNKLRNAHFEDGLSSWASANGPAVSEVASEVRSGIRAVKLEGSARTSHITQDFPVILGTTYRFSVWVKTMHLSAPATLQAKWVRDTGATLDDSTWLTASSGVGDNAYTLITVAGAPPSAAAVGVRVVLSLPENATGVVWFDDVFGG